MAAVWTITYNGVEKSCSDWGLTARPVIRTRDRSPTSFHFTMSGNAPESGVPFAFYPQLLKAGKTVAQAESSARLVIRQNRTNTNGNWSGNGFVFTGYLAEYPAETSGRGQGMNVVFKDAIWLLQSTTFQQAWTQYTAQPVYVSRCILFMDINSWVPGLYQSVQWQLNQIISFAASCGIAIAAGTIDYSGWYLNYYHCRAITCWEAILKCLEPLPDAKVWIDGSQNPPQLNIRTRANLAALATPTGTGPGPVTLPYKGTDNAGRQHFSSKDFTPRWDLVPPQVVLQYQINNTINGQPAPQWVYDVYPKTVAGNTNGQMPFALVCPIDLTGSATVTETGTLDCEPVLCSGGTQASKRAWWASKRGGEQAKLLQPNGSPDFRVRFQDANGNAAIINDAVVTDDAGNLVDLSKYPNRIVKGSYHSWMTVNNDGKTPVNALRVRITAKVQFAEYDVQGATPAETDTNGNLLRRSTQEEFHFHAVLTNAPAGKQVYSSSHLTDSGESPVQNLAQNVYNSRATVDYDGTHEIIDPGIATTYPLAQIVGHWNVLNFSGGLADWATANMTIAGTTIDLLTNHQTIEIGPSKHLQPQDWSSMLEYFRKRLVLSSSAQRATGLNAQNSVDMAANTPDANSQPGLAQNSFQSLIGLDALDATRTNVFKLDSTTSQVTVVQQKSSDSSVLNTGVIGAHYQGTGAPNATTLIAGTAYRVFDFYVDVTNISATPTPSIELWICIGAGTNSTSVWYQLTCGS